MTIDGNGTEVDIQMAQDLYRTYLVKNFSLGDLENTFPLQNELLPLNIGHFAAVSIQVVFDYAFNQKEISMEASEQNWQDVLFKLLQSANAEFARPIQQILEKVINELSVSDMSDLYNEIIMAGIRLRNKDDSDSPYYVYESLIEKRKDKIHFDFKMPEERDFGYDVRLNPQYFENNLTRESVYVKDLPNLNYKKLFTESIDGFRKLNIENKKKFNEYIQNLTGSDWDIIETGTLGSSYFSNLLGFSTERTTRLSSLQVKFCSLLTCVYSKETKILENKLLSEADEQLLLYLNNIVECEKGKDETIETLYHTYLDSAFKIHSPANSLSDIVNTFLIEQVEKLIKGGDTYCVKTLCGFKFKEIVEQGPHQASYIRNMIPYLGPLIFDTHTKTLYVKLLNRSRQEVMETLYRHLKPTSLIENLTQQLNEKLKDEKLGIYTKIQNVLNNNTIWESDDKNNTMITKQGTILLLDKLEVIKAAVIKNQNQEDNLEIN